ncbi:PAS domain-containing sensor histidine kinase [Pelomonas sp. KK5]|uniref:sensor histidine kinase n=1 Tax=Pelomonas sp. KK5 TaxID=1855730 RepID=UPI00097C752C|nr:ATP-binding protein [Pelomonas sp. KK5]
MSHTLQWRMAALLMAAALAGVGIHLGLLALGLPAWWALVLTAVILLPLAAWGASRLMAPLQRLMRALEGAVFSYRDGDFSVTLSGEGRRDEFGELLRLHGELGQSLREQRQHLAQRELLLDTVVQNTPVALLLTDARGQIVIANLAARQLLAGGRSLAGTDFAALRARLPSALQQALDGGEDGLFSLAGEEGAEETYHLSRRELRLQGRPHVLRLIRRMTRELSRQEVASWKRVIRVISHELNNSLAPISSLAHSGAELARRGSLERLPGVFDSIGARAAHLHRFLDGYATFAKLPSPQVQEVRWPLFLEGLAAHGEFRLVDEPPAAPGRFDPVQIEQLLINLVKNAHEAGGTEVTLKFSATLPRELAIEVCDNGPGMSEAVLAQALLPFYSTKRSGTGLGLALAREIAEAHGGRIALANRVEGGLRVTVTLPQ